MSDDDVLSKMDALLKRHQPDPLPHQEVPTLTQVVEAAEPAAAALPVLTEILVPGATDATPAEPPASPQASTESPAPAEAFAAAPAVDPKLLERMVAEKVNDWLEQAMPEKLAQLDVYAEDLVQDLVVQEIVRHMELLARDMTKLVQDEIRKALASLPLEHGKPPK